MLMVFMLPFIEFCNTNSDDEYICNSDTILPTSKLCDGKVDCPLDGYELGEDENYIVCPPGDGKNQLTHFSY